MVMEPPRHTRRSFFAFRLTRKRRARSGSTLGLTARKQRPQVRCYVVALLIALGVAATATAAGGGAVGGCPDARVCSDYVVVGVGWQPRRNGRVVIHYRINPHTTAISRLRRSLVVRAIRTAAATWMAADPRLALVYDGTTRARAAENNVFAFGPGGPSAVTQITHGPGGYFRGRYTHFDVRFSSDITWRWRPCAPTKGDPCTSYSDSATARATVMDIQDVATHEWGHVVGLEHANGADDDEMSMWGGLQNASRLCGPTSVCRWRDTLGLGDVLGVRHLYPINAPLPTIELP
jgi:hypothetical protein